MKAASVEERSVADRLEAVYEQIDALRARNQEMLARAAGAFEHARSARDSLHVQCNHAEQAEHMRVELDSLAHELAGLRTAMQTRGVIEQAKGMLMLHRQCGADEAFATLVSLSQTSHRKLSEVAQTLVESWTAGHAPT